MLSKRLIKSNDAAGGVCLSDETDIFGDGSGVALYQLNWDGSDKGGQYDGVATDVSFVNGKIDSAGSFNGSSSSLDTNYSLGSATNSSFSMWFKTASTSTKFLATQSSGSPYTSSFHIALVSSATELEIQIGSLYDTFTIPYVADNNWHHLVVSRTAASGYTLYLDNSSIGTFSNTTALEAADFYIGTRFDNTSLTWLGSIDQVRIFNKALSASEVTTLYNEVACEKTCTTDDNQLVSDCIAYYKLDGNADDALNTYDGTPTNVSWTQGRFGSAGGFNGSSSYIYNTSTLMWSSDISISAWFKTTENQRSPIVSIGRGSWTDGFELQVPSANTVGFSFAEGSKFGYFNSSIDLNDGNWHHYVQVSNSSTAKFFIDGVEQTGITTGNGNSRQGSGVRIGRFFQTPEQWANGSIDQVRIYDRAITATEVETLYNEVACPSGASFNTVLYTGNGSTQNVGSVEFQPDLVWAKGRSVAYSHVLTDSVRGAGAHSLFSDLNIAEDTSTSYLSSFNTDGFTLTSQNGLNQSGQTYVAWCWKAGGPAVENTDGSITSEVSANVDAGFSIVSYTGSATINQTVGHGLSSKPDLIIVKNRSLSGESWAVYNSYNGADFHMLLNTTQEAKNNVDWIWNDTEPTNSVFTVGQFGLTNQSPNEFIAYCWHSVAGFSKFGSYTGNGSTNVITTGFEPAFVIIKAYTSADNWVMIDNKRGLDNRLYSDLSNAEDALANRITFDANGFTLTTSAYNASGFGFIYMAFANQF